VKRLSAALVFVAAAANAQTFSGFVDIVHSATGIDIRERIPDRIIREPIRSSSSTSRCPSCRNGCAREKSIRPNRRNARSRTSFARRC
jgi:hypothetical protein